MLSKLRDLRVILVIVLILSWALAGGGFFLLKTTSNKALTVEKTKVGQLQQSLTQIGELVPAYTLRADIIAGKKIEETDLQQVNLPIGVSTNLVKDLTQVVGKYYKLDIKKGTVLTDDSIYDEPIADDERLFDIVTHSNPIGLQPGSYVDVRIAMPMGEDYIGLAHKKVIAINSGILKLVLNENDIHAYNSMLVDSIIYSGTQIYAVQYIQGSTQKAADTYYPVSKNVVAIAQKDPNLLNAIKSDMLQRRDVLDTELESVKTGKPEDTTATITKGRSNIIKSITESQRQVDKDREEFEKQQELLNKK